MYLAWSWDARSNSANWSCEDICRRGTPDADLPRMRFQRCGFGPEDGGIPPSEREDWPPPGAPSFDGLEAEVCPAWYYRSHHEAAVAAVYADEASGVQLTRTDPSALIDAVALVRQAKRSWLAAQRAAPEPTGTDPLG